MLLEKKYVRELNVLNEYIKTHQFVSLSYLNKLFKSPNESLLDEIENYLNDANIDIISDEEDIDLSTANIQIDYDVNNNYTKDDLKSLDVIKMYLSEIGNVPLLDQSEEQKYATIIQKGMVAEDKLANDNSLTDNDRFILKEVVEEGLNARRVLITSNLRLVVAIAKNFTSRGLNFMDLVQEGNLGLIKAVYRFDPTKGYRFSTYGTWWIRQAITRAIADKARKIRIPVHIVDAIYHMNKKKTELLHRLEREPTIEEIAEEMNISVDKAINLFQLSLDIQSLDDRLGDDDSSLSDMILDETLIRPSEYAENIAYKEQINKLLSTLSDKEEKVIRLRYGLDDNIQHTFEDVGQSLGITKERVRQIEVKAISRLRHPSRIKILTER